MEEKEIQKTEEMKRFEIETGKNAIWNDQVTEQFKKWKKGETIYEAGKDRITIILTEDEKKKWKKFSEDNKFTYLSYFIIKAINFFIEKESVIKSIIRRNSFFPQIIHKIKEALTVIEGYSELCLKNEDIPQLQEFLFKCNFLKKQLDWLLIKTVPLQEKDIIDVLGNFLNNVTSINRKLVDLTLQIESTSLEMLENANNKDFDTEITSILKEINLKTINIKELLTSTEEDDGKDNDEDYDILIVEDDYSTIKMISMLLDKKGITCKSVMNGEDGIEELKRSKPKLILLDILLPSIEGYEVCKYIKSNEIFNDIPVYYITALDPSQVIKKMEQNNYMKADDIFYKPFNIMDLGHKIEKLFQDEDK